MAPLASKIHCQPSLQLTNSNPHWLIKLSVNRKFRSSRPKLLSTSPANKRLRKIVKAKLLNNWLLSLTQLNLRAMNQTPNFRFPKRIKGRVWRKLSQNPILNKIRKMRNRKVWATQLVNKLMRANNKISSLALHLMTQFRKYSTRSTSLRILQLQWMQLRLPQTTSIVPTRDSSAST